MAALSLNPFSPHGPERGDGTVTVGFADQDEEVQQHDAHASARRGGQEGPPPARGRQLGLLLDTLNQKFDFGEEKFTSFVSLADVAVRDMKEQGILNVLFSSKVDRSRHSLDDPVKQHGKHQDKNSSLLLAFMFYAAMQIAGTASFSATQLANETMTLWEVDKFCRDFQIIPNMLSKHEVKALWGEYGIAYQLKHRDSLTAMTFADFQEFFVRMALYSYNKRGMKAMIDAVNGHFPQPQELVRFFCAYCNLHDYGKVKTRIRTVGAKTQGALNFRSAHEANVRAREEQMIDLRAKSLLRQAQKDAQIQEAEFNRKRDEKRRKAEELKAEKHRALISGNGPGPGRSMSLNGSEGEDGDAPSSSQSQSLTKRGSPSKKQLLREHLLLLTSLQKSPLPRDILGLIEPQTVKQMQRLEEKAAHDLLIGIAELPKPDDLVPHTHLMQAEPGLPLDMESLGMGIGRASAGNGLDDDDDEESEFHAEDDLSCAMGQYNDELLDELARYSYNEPGVAPLEGGESGGPFLDMGNLPPSAVCCVSIKMRNLLPHDVTIDVLARGFDSADTKVNTKTKPVVPGMSRVATVSFTTSNRVGAQVGIISIHAYSAAVHCRTSQNLMLSCPVFYRIDPSVKPRSLMDIRSFPDAKQRYLGGKEDLRVSFERRIDAGSTFFARPSSAAAGAGRSRGQSRLAYASANANSSSQPRISVSEPVIGGTTGKRPEQLPLLQLPSSSSNAKAQQQQARPKSAYR